MPEATDTPRPPEAMDPADKRRELFRLSFRRSQERTKSLTETGEKFYVEKEIITQADLKLQHETDRTYAEAQAIETRLEGMADDDPDREGLEQELIALQEHGIVFANATSFDRDVRGTKLRFYLLESLDRRLMSDIPETIQAKLKTIQEADTFRDFDIANIEYRDALDELPPEERKRVEGVQRERADIHRITDKLDRAMAGRVGIRERMVDWAAGKVDESSIRAWVARELVAKPLGLDYDDLREGKTLSAAGREALGTETVNLENFARAIEINELDKLADEVEAAAREQSTGTSEEDVPATGEETEAEGTTETGERELTADEEEALAKSQEFMSKENRTEWQKWGKNFSNKLVRAVEGAGTDEEKLQAVQSVFSEAVSEISGGNPEVKKILGQILNNQNENQPQYLERNDVSFWRMFLLVTMMGLADGVLSIPGELARGATQETR